VGKNDGDNKVKDDEEIEVPDEGDEDDDSNLTCMGVDKER
jgi:hypothetical protein